MLESSEHNSSEEKKLQRRSLNLSELSVQTSTQGSPRLFNTLTTPRHTPREDGNTGESDILSARFNEKNRTHQHAQSFIYFIDQCEKALKKLVALCDIVGSHTSAHSIDTKQDSTWDTTKVTLYQIFEKIGQIESYFIKRTLYEPLFDADPNRQLRACTLLEECVLKNWPQIAVIKPDEKQTQYSSITAMRTQLLNSVLAPQEQGGTHFFDRRDAKEQPLTCDTFLTTHDLHTLFFRMNAYHLPSVGGTPFRSIYEHAMLEFSTLFNTTLAIPDFEHKEQRTHPFQDSDAYKFYFLETIVPIISTLTKYTISMIDDVLEIVNYGWKKMKKTSFLKGIDHTNSQKYKSIENSLRHLQQLTCDENFQKLRSTPNQTPKHSPRNHAQYVQTVESSLREVFGDIPIHKEKFDVERDVAWIKTVNECILHHPLSKMGSNPTSEPSAHGSLTLTNQICLDLLNLIERTFHHVQALTPLLSTTGDHSTFYQAFCKICAIPDEPIEEQASRPARPTHSRNHSSTNLIAASTLKEDPAGRTGSKFVQDKTQSGTLRRVQSSGFSSDVAPIPEESNGKLLLRRSNQERRDRPVYMRKYPAGQDKKSERPKSATYGITHSPTRSPQPKRKSGTGSRNSMRGSEQKTLSFLLYGTSSRDNSPASSATPSPRDDKTIRRRSQSVAPSNSPSVDRKSVSPPVSTPELDAVPSDDIRSGPAKNGH